jgi:hypothetical protein
MTDENGIAEFVKANGLRLCSATTVRDDSSVVGEAVSFPSD